MPSKEKNISVPERQARERLSVLRSQALERALERSALGRQIKNLRRRDFKQQMQPKYARIKNRRGHILNRVEAGGVWGRSRGQAPGRGQQIEDLRSKPTQTPAPGVVSSRSRVRITGGESKGRSVQSPTSRWTTEGYQSINNPSHIAQRRQTIVSRDITESSPSVLGREGTKNRGASKKRESMRSSLVPSLSMLYPGAPMNLKSRARGRKRG